MRPELKQWRDLSKEDKERIKSENNIKIVTYDFIKKLYFESL